MSEMEDRCALLSPRQLEVMVRVCWGKSSREIGEILGLSRATVDSHVAVVLQRLQLGTRREAARELQGLLELPNPPPQISAALDRLALHHGEAPPHRTVYQSSPMVSGVGKPLETSRWKALFHFSKGNFGSKGKQSAKEKRRGMAPVVLRCLMDAFYIILFFTVMSLVAAGAHQIVIICKFWNVDPVVLYILKGVSYFLAGIDAVGVVTATGLLTFRFVRAIVRADD